MLSSAKREKAEAKQLWDFIKEGLLEKAAWWGSGRGEADPG